MGKPSENRKRRHDAGAFPLASCSRNEAAEKGNGHGEIMRVHPASSSRHRDRIWQAMRHQDDDEMVRCRRHFKGSVPDFNHMLSIRREFSAELEHCIHEAVANESGNRVAFQLKRLV